MPGSVISDHVWLNKAGTGVATQAVLKRYLVSALNGSADDRNAHIHSLSGNEYTPRRLYCVRPDSLCCRSDPQSKNAVHNIPPQFRPGYHPLNGSQFHELLQPLHGVHHHSVDSGDRWPGGRPLCPPASERFDTDAEKRRSLLLANVSVANLLLGGWQSPETSGHPASQFLDEFLFSQCGNCWALVTKDARE